LIERQAVLQELSRHVFVLSVILPNYRERVSFRYLDLLTPAGGVEIIRWH
jgi:uncharacterized protein Veg